MFGGFPHLERLCETSVVLEVPASTVTNNLGVWMAYNRILKGPGVVIPLIFPNIP